MLLQNYRQVGDTLERDELYTVTHHDMRDPIYPENFDYLRAQADLQSILDGSLTDAFPWVRENGVTRIPNAGYGWILHEQLPAALHRLRHNIHSRQASVVFWNGQGSPSCTLTADFKVRHGVLNSLFIQRSSDETQTPYDLYNFTGITRWIYDRLYDEIELGTLTLITTSSHRYI
jgi:hypothetical protein